MLQIIDLEYYEDVLKEIARMEERQSVQLKERFEEKIEYLKEFGEGHFIIELRKNIAPLSFSIDWVHNGDHLMNSGLIFHEGRDQKEPRWVIHTT